MLAVSQFPQNQLVEITCIFLFLVSVMRSDPWIYAIFPISICEKSSLYNISIFQYKILTYKYNSICNPKNCKYVMKNMASMCVQARLYLPQFYLHLEAKMKFCNLQI